MCGDYKSGNVLQNSNLVWKALIREVKNWSEVTTVKTCFRLRASMVTSMSFRIAAESYKPSDSHSGRPGFESRSGHPHLGFLLMVSRSHEPMRMLGYFLTYKPWPILPRSCLTKQLDPCLYAIHDKWLDYSPHASANLGRFPTESFPEFRLWESCGMMLLVGWFSRGSLVSPALAIRRFSMLTLTSLYFQDSINKIVTYEAGEGSRRFSWAAAVPRRPILADKRACPADVKRGARQTHPRRSEGEPSQTANIFSTSYGTVGLTFVLCAGIALI
ncbi:hypothetical protein PR048_028701 [Dryococelus australis]|uniref:Uncharacterized protein n=1 Tax=Dryococelus australis TaxID=614101 RepID=A0ABQ9GBD2_9NEOP|nr:hypothetical protein PR048_028701 [Dryococelus australis]